MHRGVHSLGVLWLATLAMAQGPATVPEATKTPSDFVRFVKVGDGGHLDTAVTTYRNDRGIEVALYAAVHIADAQHYAALQERFPSRDALLYELVAEADVRPQKGEGGSGSMVSLLQAGMKSALELEFQLDAVDYTAPNFVHADMTPTEFAAAMKERGESIWSTILNLGRAAARSQEDGDVSDTGFSFDLVKAFRSGEGRHRLRVMMASQLARAEMLGGASEARKPGDGDDPKAPAAKPQAKGSTLLEGRNQKCFEVLARELQAGKQRLGIYYGAAHLPDMEQRLLAQGFRKTGQEWLQAWDCAPRPDPKADRELWAQRRTARTDVEALAKAARSWQSEHNELRAPSFVELAQPRSDGKPFAAAKVDPWGKDYAIAGYPQADAALPELIDVWSAGQDGTFDTADDIHSLASRELRRSRRAQDASGKREVAVVQGLFDGLHKQARIDKALKAKADVAALATTIKVFEQLKKRLPQPGELTAPDEHGVSFMAEWPIDPWGNDYIVRPIGNRLEVRSAGPDGIMDTEDDVLAGRPQTR